MMNPIQDRVASWVVDLAYLDITTQVYTLVSLVLQGVGAVWTLVKVLKGVWSTGGTILAKVRARKESKIKAEGVRLRRAIREVMGEFMPEGDEVELSLDNGIDPEFNLNSRKSAPNSSRKEKDLDSSKCRSSLPSEQECMKSLDTRKKGQLPPGIEFGELNSKPE